MYIRVNLQTYLQLFKEIRRRNSRLPDISLETRHLFSAKQRSGRNCIDAPLHALNNNTTTLIQIPSLNLNWKPESRMQIIRVILASRNEQPTVAQLNPPLVKSKKSKLSFNDDKNNNNNRILHRTSILRLKYYGLKK